MQGFEDVVIQQQRKVYSFAHYFLGSPEEAEDVTQEVFLKLWQNWSKVDLDRVRPWLLRVTQNACYDRLRKRRSTARVINSDADPEIVESRPGADPGPEVDARRADDEEVYIFFKEEVGQMVGLTVLTLEDSEAMLINLVGNIDPSDLSGLAEGLALDLPQIHQNSDNTADDD